MKQTSPLIPSLKKNYMIEGENGYQKNNQIKGRGFHFKKPSQNKMPNFDLKLKKNILFNNEGNNPQFLSSRMGKGEISKKGGLFDRTEFQRYKKGNTVKGSFNIKANSVSYTHLTLPTTPYV